MATIRQRLRSGTSARTSYARADALLQPRTTRPLQYISLEKLRPEGVADGVEADIGRGSALDLQLRKKLFDEWADEWPRLARRSAPSTLISYESLPPSLRPNVGRFPLEQDQPPGVQRFLGKMTDKRSLSIPNPPSPPVLSIILNAAVNNGYTDATRSPRERLKGSSPSAIRTHHLQDVHVSLVPSSIGFERWSTRSPLATLDGEKRRSPALELQHAAEPHEVKEPKSEVSGGLHDG